MTEDISFPSNNQQQNDVSKDNQADKPLFGKLGTSVLTAVSFVLCFVTMVVTLFIAIPIVKLLFPTNFAGFTSDTQIQSILSNGTLLGVSVVLNLVVLVFYCWVILKIRHKKFHQYLAFKSFTFKTTLICIGLWFLYVIASEALFYLTNHQPMDFMDVYFNSADPLWLLILGIVVIAPIYEELIFRGLLWRAIAEFGNAGKNGQPDKRGAVIATIVTGLLFTAIHLQYGMLEMNAVFTLALILGFARYRSGSLLLPILLHMINNGLSMFIYIYAS